MTNEVASLVRRVVALQGPVLSVAVPIEHGRTQPLTVDGALAALKSEIRAELAVRHVAPAAVARWLESLVLDRDDVAAAVHGVAWFMSPDEVVHVALATAPSAQWHLGDHADVLVLLADLELSPFHLLALADDRAALYLCDRTWVAPVVDEELSKPRAEVLRYEDLEPVSDTHGSGPVGRGLATIHHGGDTAHDVKRAAIERYLRHVEHCVRRHLRQRADVLVVAAVHEDTALYRKLSVHEPVIELPIGSASSILIERLAAEARALVVAGHSPAATIALRRYGDQVGTGLTAAGPSAVMDAAVAGRVHTAIVSEAVVAAGVAAPDADPVREAAALTIARGGDAVLAPADAMEGDLVRANLRY
jgi:hypothetical protein